MKTLFLSSKFKKDYKRYKRYPEKVEALKEVLKLLREEKPIPSDYKPHPLKGQYKGCMECHIEDDYLLIWLDPKTDIIELVRLGSHSELFGKKK